MKQKKYTKIGAGVVAILICAVVLINTFYQNTAVAYAKESLPGVESIIAANGNGNPYTILEVVPDKSQAALGFLAAGEEPIATEHSCRDLLLKEEREKAFQDLKDSISDNTAKHPYAELFGDTEDKPLSIVDYSESENGTKSFSLRGKLQPNEEGKYVSTFTEADYKLITDPDSTYVEGDTKYKKYTEFSDFGKDGKAVIFTKIDTSAAMPRTMTIEGETGTFETAYKYEITLSEWNGSNADYILPDLSKMEGKFVFKIGANQYEYFGRVEKLGGTVTTRSPLPEETLSGNTVSDNLLPKPEEVEPSEEKPTEEHSSEERPSEERPSEEKPTEETSSETQPTETDPVETNTEEIISTQESFVTYALEPQQRAAEIWAIHASDGKYLVFDANDQVTIDGITTELIDETTLGRALAIGTAAENDNLGDYYISEIKNAAEIPDKPFYGFRRYNWYNPDENGEYYLVSDAEYGYALCDIAAHPEEGAAHYDWITDYTYSAFEEIKYDGGIENQEWFKKFVFDREENEYEQLVIDIKTVTIEEFNAYDLTGVDLLYFTGKTAYSEDINPVQARDVFYRVVTERMPVMMEESFRTNNTGMPNLYKLAVLLRQANLEAVDIKKDAKDVSALEKEWDNTNYWTDLETKIKEADTVYGASYINKSVYVFDDVCLNSAGEASKFVSENFHEKFTEEQIAYGFLEVEAEIKNENLYRQLSGKDKLDTEISQAAAIRYIINYASQRNVIKSKINVLEIQPCASAQYNEGQLLDYNYRKGTHRASGIEKETIDAEYIGENWATQFKGKAENISLKKTHTAEFIGKIEDLNENYDMIFIGMDTSTMNTAIDGRGRKTNQTVYNDNSMNGLVYTHTGDRARIPGDDRYYGLLNPNNPNTESTMTGFGDYRYSGNDITVDRLRDLKEYIDAGFPIVFGNGFFEKNSNDEYYVNYNKVDTTSYLYALGEYILKKGYMNQRAFIDKEVSDSDEHGVKKLLSERLNLSKLTVELTKVPTAYRELDTASYLTAVNGVYTLEYEFNLKNDAALSLLDTKYDCRLYIDSNVDGRYSQDEEIDGLQIFEWTNGRWNPISTTLVSTSEGNVEKFQLMAGHYYRMQRQLPTGYVGVLPWKLIFEQNDNVLVRKSASGYSAVPIVVSERQVIKVLQLTSGSNGDGAFGTKLTLDLTSESMKSLFRQVQDFEIQVSKQSVQDYIQTISEVIDPMEFSEYFNVLNEYDMLILGFTDCYVFGNGTDNQSKAAALALRKYISDGRSVLFTHDTTSYRNTNTEWGYFFNRYIRDIVGMDRYGVMNQIAQNEGFTPASPVVDIAWKPSKSTDAGKEILPNRQGYTDVRLSAGATEGHLVGSNPYTYNSRPALAKMPTGQYPYDNMYVTEVNKGQITEYPFQIPERFQVANTHAQYYQLNLDTNSKDNYLDDDIVVWYCISDVKDASFDDTYQSVPNDARNNYYIYNKGNVTYSGVGHSTVNQALEQKLFVNTMVAAYNSGVHPPRVIYKESGKKDAAQIEYTYLPYDEAIAGTGAFLDDECRLFFEISDSNFIQGTKEIDTAYYLEVKPEEIGASPVMIDGKEVYLKKLEESQIAGMSNVGTGEILTGEARHKVSNNTTYQMTIDTAVLNLTGKNAVNLYIGAKTTYRRNGKENTTEVGYYKMNIVKTQLFDLE